MPDKASDITEKTHINMSLQVFIPFLGGLILVVASVFGTYFSLKNGQNSLRDEMLRSYLTQQQAQAWLDSARDMNPNLRLPPIPAKTDIVHPMMATP